MGFQGFNGEVQFSLGYVLGVRGFRLDTMGRFTGWSFKSVWKPGENVSVCGRQKTQCNESLYNSSLYSSSYSYHSHTESCYVPNPCDGDIENCDHGFWAYYDDFDSQGEHIAENGYTAIIKGYGKTVLGTKGFRAEKAEIVAVAIPWSYESPARPRIVVERNYPDLKVYNTKTEMFNAFPVEDQTPKKPTDPRNPDFWTFDPTTNQKIIRRVEGVPVPAETRERKSHG